MFTLFLSQIRKRKKVSFKYIYHACRRDIPVADDVKS